MTDHPADRCEVCHSDPLWRLDRHGDAVCSWACREHLATVMERMQRPDERTKITVYYVWAEALLAIGREAQQ